MPCLLRIACSQQIVVSTVKSRQFIPCAGTKLEEETEQESMKTCSIDELEQKHEMLQKQYENAIQHSDALKRYLEVWERKQSEWKSQKVNIAVTGHSARGKSSFISALARNWTNKPCPAKSGSTEAIDDCVAYEHPNNPNITFWDLPTVGASDFPQEQRLAEVTDADAFIILTATKFGEEDSRLGRKLQEKNKAVIFVRTKIGIDVDRCRRDCPEMDDKAILETVRKTTTEGCADLPSCFDLFLIDNRRSDTYEFNDLEKCIKEKLTVLKGQALVLSIGNMSKNNLRLKVDELKSHIADTVVTASVLGAFPGMSAFTDEAIVYRVASFYKDQLDLDTDSLEERSVDPGKRESLESKVRGVTVDIPNIVRLHGLHLRDAGSILSAFGSAFFRPTPGLNTCASALTVSNSLEDVLDTFEAISLEAIDAC